jgi:thioredoxin-dependent peroxiredoxin
MKTITGFFLLFFIVLTSLTFSQEELKEGSQSPDFTLEDAFENEYTLSSYFGESPIVIYFYPKAGTSGCTKQACAIRDDWNKFEENNIKVLGISTDTKEEIEKFVEDYSLNFPLLSDADKAVSKKFGVLKDNGLAKRVTFIINIEGEIAEIIEVNDIDSHSDYVFNAASKLN